MFRAGHKAPAEQSSEGDIRRQTVAGIIRRRKDPHRALDHVNSQFRARRPSVLWVSDFTYVATWTGFVYVAFVIDA